MTVSTLAPRARRKMVPTEPPDPVTQYALDVVAGRVVAGVLVHKACERHLSDLATGHARGLHFDREAAQKAIAFFPLLRHYKGEWGPHPGEATGRPDHPRGVAGVHRRLDLRLEARGWAPPVPPRLRRGRQEEREDADGGRPRDPDDLLRRRAWRRGLLDRHQARPGEAHLERRQADGDQEPPAGGTHSAVRAQLGGARHGQLLQAPGQGLGRIRAGCQPALRRGRRAARPRGARVGRQHRDRNGSPSAAAPAEDHHRRREARVDLGRGARRCRRGGRGPRHRRHDAGPDLHPRRGRRSVRRGGLAEGQPEPERQREARRHARGGREGEAIARQDGAVPALQGQHPDRGLDPGHQHRGVGSQQRRAGGPRRRWRLWRTRPGQRQGPDGADPDISHGTPRGQGPARL